jgi:hypothetical protein
MPVDHHQQNVVANAVAALLCRLKQAIDLRTVQKILRALVSVGRFRLTLYSSPVEAYVKSGASIFYSGRGSVVPYNSAAR